MNEIDLLKNNSFLPATNEAGIQNFLFWCLFIVQLIFRECNTMRESSYVFFYDMTKQTCIQW